MTALALAAAKAVGTFAASPSTVGGDGVEGGAVHLRITAVALATVVATALIPAAPTWATPVCDGSDKTLCGGRTFPEPMDSATALTYAETVRGLSSLAAEFPDWITVSSIGSSYDGYDLVMVEITDPASTVPLADRKVVLVSQSIHGNEPGGREGGVRFLEDLVRGIDPEHQALLDRVRLMQVFLNPDGWTAGDHDAVPDGDSVGAWIRGNGNDILPGAGDTFGVDLNRQLPWRGWIPDGRTPMTEPEAQAIVAEIQRRLGEGQQLQASTDIHGEVTEAAAWIMLSSGQFDLLGSMTQLVHGRAVEDAVDAALSDDDLVALSVMLGQAIDAGILTASSEFGSPGVGGSGSGFLGDWLAQPEGGNTASTSTIELFAFDPDGPGVNSTSFRREIFQIYRTAVKAIMGALMEQAVVDYEVAVTLPGSVGYVVDPSGTTDPILSGLRSPMDFFADLAPYVTPSLVPVPAGAVTATALSGLTTVVVTSDLLAADAAALSALRAFAEAGGTVVLTDAAARLLPGLVDGISADDVTMSTSNIAPVSFPDPAHPLLAGMRANAYLLIEPATIGYQATGPGGDTPAWRVARSVWEAAGGTTVGTIGSQTAIGELALGAGAVRTIGLLLPPPITEHQVIYGLNSYALTDAGYTVFINALDGGLAVAPATGGDEPAPSTAPTPNPAPDEPMPVTGGAFAAPALALLAAATRLRRR